MKFNILLLLTVVLFSGTATAQLFPNQIQKEDLIEKLPYNKKKSIADGLFRAGSFYNAEKYYQQLKQEQPRNAYASMMVAECAWKNRDYPLAAKNYREAYDFAPAIYPDAPFREALMLKSDARYPEAKERLQFYIDHYKGKDKKMKLLAKRQIEGCDKAMISLADPAPVYIKNAGPNVNTAFTESSPMPLGDSALLFSTMHTNKLIESNKDNRKDYVARLMWSPKEFDRTKVKDSFEVAMPFEDGRFNDSRFHVSNGVWSSGRDRFYFTKCLEEDSLNIKCTIFSSNFDKTKGLWSSPAPLDQYINDESGSNTNPMPATIGKKEILYFSSNRKGTGAGGYDIYYSVYDEKNKTYRRPQNCGKKVNTNKDEITPWYDSRKGKLYFSSNGWVSFGGFDVFSADGGPSRYTNIINLGAPYNSPADDMGYIEDNNDKGNGYLVSNRLGTTYIKNPTCCDDIWRIIKEPNLYVKGNVIDEVTGEHIGQAVVKLDDDATNKIVDTNYSADGKFRFYTPMAKNYTITADKVGYASGRATVSTVGKTAADPDEEVNVDIYMRKISDNNTFHVRNVYYNFDLQQFQPDSYSALDSLTHFMKDNPSLSVEVISNTDSKGSDEYNDKLSMERANQVINYLVGKGIDRGRMIAKPQGKNKPVASNTKAGGKDNPEGRQFNRRTEFKIIGDAAKAHLIYDNNRPQYIDKSGSGRREENLKVKDSEETDQGAVPVEATQSPIAK